MGDDTLRLSHTRIATYAECGEKYRQRYLTDNAPEPQGALLGGIAVHETIERAEAEEWWQDDEAFQHHGKGHVFFAETLDNLVAERGGDDAIRWGGRRSRQWPQKETRAWWHEYGPGMLMRYQRTRHSDVERGFESLHVEVEVNFHLDGDLVTTRIDHVLADTGTGECFIRDYKTGRSQPKEALQTTLYALAVEETLKLPVAFAELVHLRKADDGPVRYLVEPYKGVVKTWTKQAKEGILSGQFTMSPSSWCGSCDVRRYCAWGATLPDDEEA